jgi:hypothetical protein
VAGATLTLKLPLAALLRASVTVAVKLNKPARSVVPTKFPFPFIVTPGGMVPAEIFHLYGVAPPVALNTSL